MKAKHVGNFIPSTPIKLESHEFLPTKVEGDLVLPTGLTPFKQTEHFAPLNPEHKFPQSVVDDHSLGGHGSEQLFKFGNAEHKFPTNTKEQHHFKIHPAPAIRHEHQQQHQPQHQQQKLISAQPIHKQQLHIQPPHLQQPHAQHSQQSHVQQQLGQQNHVQQQLNQQNHAQQNHAQQQHLQQQLAQAHAHIQQQHQHIQPHAQSSHIQQQHIQASAHVQQQYDPQSHGPQTLAQAAHPPKAQHLVKPHQQTTHPSGKIEEHYKIFPGQNNLKHEPHIQIHFEEHPPMNKPKPAGHVADAHHHRYKTYKVEDPHFKINPIPIKPGNQGPEIKQTHQNEIKSEIHYVPPKHGDQNNVVQPVEAFGNKFNFEYKFKTAHKFNEFHRPNEEKGGVMFEIRAKPEKPIYHQQGGHNNQPSITTNYYYPKVINTDERQPPNHKGYLPKKNDRPVYKAAQPAPHVEYFIPKEQDVTSLEVQSQASVSSDAQLKSSQLVGTNEYFLPKKEPEYHTEQPQKYHSSIKQNSQDPPFFMQKYFDFPANQPKRNITSYFSITPNSHKQEIHFQTVHDETYDSQNEYNHPEPHHEHQHQFSNDQHNVYTAEHLQIPHPEQHVEPQPFTANSAKIVQPKSPNDDDIRPVFEYLNESEDNKPHIAAEPVDSEAEDSLTENYPVQISTTAASISEEPKITTYKNSAMFSTSTTTTTANPPTTLAAQAESRADVEEITRSPMVTNPTACQRRCVKNTVARDYDPVCGSDGRTYSNKGKLRCAQSCGKTGEYLFLWNYIEHSLILCIILSELTIKAFGACHREQQAN